jgi:hypothetical protein
MSMETFASENMGVGWSSKLINTFHEKQEARF